MAARDNCPLSARVDNSLFFVYNIVCRQTTFPKRSSSNLHAYVIIAVIDLNNLLYSKTLQSPN